MYCRALILLTTAFIARASAHYVDDSKSGYTLILPENDLQQPMALSFEEAQQWCSTNAPGSQLASINANVTHDSITSFLDNATKEGRLTDTNIQLIRLNARYHPSNKWSWINGHEAKGFDVSDSEPRSVIYLNGVIWAWSYFRIYAYRSTSRFYYICEYSDNRKKCQLYLNRRWYVTKEFYSPTWYGARNDCLNEGGDLASFETLSDQTLKNSLKNLSLYFTQTNGYQYWVGIQKGAWIWEDSKSPIQLTNWASNGPYNSEAQCLCLHSLSQWKWMGCSCSELHPFICIDQLKDQNIRLAVGITVLCLIMVVAISVVFFFLFKRLKRRISLDSRQANQTSELISTSGDIERSAPPQTSEFTKSKAECGNSINYIQPDGPIVHSVVQKPKAEATSAIYASVQTHYTPGNYPRQKENEPPSNSVVYADLDILPSDRQKLSRVPKAVTFTDVQ